MGGPLVSTPGGQRMPGRAWGPPRSGAGGGAPGGGAVFWPPSAVCPTLAGFHNVVALMHVDGNSPRSPQAPGVCPAPHPAPSSRGPALWSDAERAMDQEPALCPPGPSSPRPARCPAAPTRAAALAVCTLFMLQRILHLPSVLTCPSDHVYAPLHHSRRAFLFRECVTTAHSTLDPRLAHCPFSRDRCPGNEL